MAKKQRHVSETPATMWLRRHGVAFSEHTYDYVDHGGTTESARQLGVDEHAVVKTLVMQDDKTQPLVVLMHGDRQVSTKNLARAIGVKSVEACAVEIAQSTARAPSRPLSTAGSMPTRKPRRPPLIQMRGSASTLACTHTGMALRVPKGEVPPTR
jgi:hypothetical protein